MGQVLDHIDDNLATFISAQRVFFVASAPSAADGHVNISPKGHADTFVVLGPTRVAYLDLTGSGAESIAHIRENGRLTVMFCAFNGPPKVLRLHGRAHVAFPDDPAFAELGRHFRQRPGARAIVVLDVTRVSTSCGFAVPLYEYVDDRDVLEKSNGRKSAAALATYHRTRNAVSIDGLPALPVRGVATNDEGPDP